MDFRKTKPNVCKSFFLNFVERIGFVFSIGIRFVVVVPTPEELKKFGYNQASLNHVLEGVTY
jgi:hypothetical protein